MGALTRFLHVLALATYLGGTLDFVLVFLPAAEAIDDPVVQRRVLARGLRPYNLLSVGALGVLIMTGASALTDMKALLGPNYARLLWPLVWKLSLTFAVTLIATYVSFGLGHRLVRAEMGELPIEAEKQRAIIRRMRGAAWLAIVLTAWAAWIGIRLGKS